jgi:hypothetical protein
LNIFCWEPGQAARTFAQRNTCSLIWLSELNLKEFLSNRLLYDRKKADGSFIVILAVVDYALLDRAFFSLMRALKNFMAAPADKSLAQIPKAKLLVVSVSPKNFWEAGPSPYTVLRHTKRALAGALRLRLLRRQRMQFWGWLRSPESIVRMLETAGFDSVVSSHPLEMKEGDASFCRRGACLAASPSQQYS